MTAIDRRSMLSALLGGAAVAIGGLAFSAVPAESVELLIGNADASRANSLVDKAQVVIVGPRHRRRRGRRCWWSRGRRVCSWG